MKEPTTQRFTATLLRRRMSIASLIVLAWMLLGCQPPGETALDPAPEVSAGGPPERINLDALGRLPAFSHATTHGGLVFVSGTLGTKPQSVELVTGGVGPETTQTMANIAQILEAANSSLDHLAKCIVYLVDMGDFAAMNEAWLEAVGSSPPARATIGVNELALGAKVEIECTATHR